MRTVVRPASAVLTCLAAALMACGPAVASGDAFSVQEELSAVKSQLLRLMAAAPDARSYVYLNVEPSLPLRSARLQILDDEGAVIGRIRFEPASARQGLLRVALPAVAREGRTCRFVIETSENDVVNQQELGCRLPDMGSASLMELRFRETWLGPELRIQRWAPGGKAKTGTHETLAPDVRYSTTLCADTPWQGLNRLYRFKGLSAAEFWRTYADCALRAGVHNEAVAALRRLQERGDAESAVFEIRLQLAAYHQRWGDTAGALAWLDPQPEQVPSQLRTRWRDLQSRLYLAQRRFEDATAVLSRGLHLEAAGSWLESFDAAYLHYAMRLNYAYALMGAGRQAEALAVLERVGSSPALDAGTGGLRAQANAVLGWHFLSQGYGATAGRIFHRVPLHSHVSNKALLGMGWAMLAPEGEAQPLVDPPGFSASLTDPPATALKPLRRIGALGCSQFNAVVPDAVQECISAETFERVDYDDPEGQLQRALRFWTVLVERANTRDAATLEAHIAAAKAYEELGALQRSQELYRRAIAASERSLASMERAQRVFADPGKLSDLVLGDSAAIADLEPALLEWLAESHTQNLLKALATTQQLSSRISTALTTRMRRTERGLDLARLHARLQAVHNQAVQVLQNDSASVLAEERRRSERYRVQAWLQLAEIQRGVAFNNR